LSLILSSGGGRLGNQLLNLMHLMALSYEYDIKLFKINDLFIEAKDGSLMFQIKKESEEINWKLVSEIKNYTFYYKILLKLFIRIIHLYFYYSLNLLNWPFLTSCLMPPTMYDSTSVSCGATCIPLDESQCCVHGKGFCEADTSYIGS